MTDSENLMRDIFIPGVSNVLESSNYRLSTTTSIQQEILPRVEKQGSYEKLNEIFEDQTSQQIRVLEARETLGESAKELTDDQVFELVTNVQYLVDIWEEEFEKAIFDGKTLKELLCINKL